MLSLPPDRGQIFKIFFFKTVPRNIYTQDKMNVQPYLSHKILASSFLTFSLNYQLKLLWHSQFNVENKSISQDFLSFLPRPTIL